MMRRSKKPPLMVDSELDDFDPSSNEPQPAHPQPRTTRPERLKKRQAASQVLVDGHLTAREIFTQQYARKDIRLLPKELILVMINNHLSDYDVVALAMTCRFFYEVAPWARQKHLKLLSPSCHCCNVVNQSPGLFRAIPLPCQALIARSRLFRERLQHSFGTDYIFCGGVDRPPMRRFFPFKHSSYNENHKNCCCIVSLIEREMDLLDAERRGSPMKKSMQYLQRIRVAQARINTKSRMGHRHELQHPVFGDLPNWPWASQYKQDRLPRWIRGLGLKEPLLDA